MKIIFIGSVQISKTVLESVYATGHSVEMIFTLPLDMAEQTSGYVDLSRIAAQNNTTLIKTKDINAKDNIKISEVFVEYMFNIGNISSIELQMNNGLYEGLIPIPKNASKVFYTISAIDSSQNWETSDLIEVAFLKKTGKEPASTGVAFESQLLAVIIIIIIFIILIGLYFRKKKKNAN